MDVRDPLVRRNIAGVEAVAGRAVTADIHFRVDIDGTDGERRAVHQGHSGWVTAGRGGGITHGAFTGIGAAQADC